MKLILFDIDDTLLNSGGAGSRAMEKAFKEVLSVSKATRSNGKVSMAGKTDPQILKEILKLHGIQHDMELLEILLRSYIKHLSTEIHTNGKVLKPAVMEVLDWLKPIETARLGLLTGNVEEGAKIKLESFGIWDRFGFGAYGSDHEDRNKLLPAAIKSFSHHTGQNAGYEDCIVIGDTPRDVECAKPYGAYTIAVATGPYEADALARAGADRVINDLSEASSALAPLLFAQ